MPSVSLSLSLPSWSKAASAVPLATFGGYSVIWVLIIHPYTFTLSTPTTTIHKINKRFIRKLWQKGMHVISTSQIGMTNWYSGMTTTGHQHTPVKQIEIEKLDWTRVSYIRFDNSIAFLASGNVKILLPKFFINLYIPIRPLLHAKFLVWSAVIVQTFNCCCPLQENIMFLNCCPK